MNFHLHLRKVKKLLPTRNAVGPLLEFSLISRKSIHVHTNSCKSSHTKSNRSQPPSTMYVFVHENIYKRIDLYFDNTSLHITSHHFIHITSHHFTSHDFTSHHFTSLHITSHHFTSLHITSHHVT